MTKIKNNFAFMYLMGIMLIVFIIQMIFPEITEIFVLNEKVFDLELWRFLTAIFLHGGGAHLASNLFALFLFGVILESTIGTKRFLLVFFVSGILSNLYSVFFYPSSLGASGAIYGIMGAVSILRPTMMVWAFGLVIPMFIAAIFWVLLDVLGLFVPDGVGHIAHLFGIFVGFMFGFYYRLRVSFVNKKSRKKDIFSIDEGTILEWERRYMG